MHWLLTASLMSALVAVPASAQRSAPMGHAGGFSAPHGFAAPHVSGGFSSGTHFSPAPGMNRPSLNTAPQFRWNVPAGNSGARPVYSPNSNRHTAPVTDSHYGHGYPPYHYDHYRQPYVPYFYARSTYLVPGLLNSYWDYPDSSYSDDQSNSYAPQEQVESNNGYEPESAPNEPQRMPYGSEQMQDVPPPPPGPVEPAPQAAITLIFKDGHSQQVHNYAVTKTTLYVLDDAASGRRPQIPIDQIDVAATVRANQASGVDFAVPSATN
jgi:hypothetical protein